MGEVRQKLIAAGVGAYQLCGSISNAIKIAADDFGYSITPSELCDLLMAVHKEVRREE